MSGRHEWFTSAELAAMDLPGIPSAGKNVRLMARRENWLRSEWEGKRWRRRQESGGGIEYHTSVLPHHAQVKLALSIPATTETPAAAADHAERAARWAWFERQSDKKKAGAAHRLEVLDAVRTMVRAGKKKTYAVMMVARQAKTSPARVYDWFRLVERIEKADWLPYLVSRHHGRSGGAACSDEAWEMFKADYLRPEKPNLSDCYDRVKRAAAQHGWIVPSQSTMRRKIEALAPQVVVAARDGVEALKKLYPAQRRDRSMFHALEAVNLDGHTWDVFVRWTDGEIVRPVMLVVQDLYSGMILSWRVDRTLHRGLVRLAIGDMVENYGIPDHCYLDNGRENASKWITGSVPNRFRFKVRDEDPAGLLPQLGVEVHWTTPYSGQSKPIERAFKDFAQRIAKHPAFAGAYVGNTPLAKPENYGSAAVPYETFLKIVAEEIVAHNARVGRRSDVCGGKLSFVQAFEASYQQAPIRLATPEQRRLWLLAAEAIRVSSRDGTVEIEGNRYWSDALLPFRGQTVVARFDPHALHEALHVYRPDGAYLGQAQCTAAAGFADVDAAREHGRARRSWMRATKELLAAERSMSITEVAALQAKAEPIAPMAEPKVVRPVFGTVGNAALAVRPDEDEVPEGERLLIQFSEMRRGGKPFGVVEPDDAEWASRGGGDD